MTTKIVFSQATTFQFAKTIDAKTKKNVGLVDINCYRNDSLFVATTSDINGDARLKNEYMLKSQHKYRLVVSAVGYQRQYINLGNEIKYPIIVLLTKKKGQNLKTKVVDFSPTHCVEPKIKESEKIRDSIRAE